MLKLSICGATGPSEVIFSITREYYRLEHLELIIVFDWHRCMNSGVRLEFLCLCCFYVICSDSDLSMIECTWDGKSKYKLKTYQCNKDVGDSTDTEMSFYNQNNSLEKVSM